MEQGLGRIPDLFEARRDSHLVRRLVLALFVQIDLAEPWGNVDFHCAVARISFFEDTPEYSEVVW